MASARPDSAGMATYRVHWCAVRGRRQGRLSRRWGPGPLPAREKREAGVPGVWRGWTPGGQEGPGTEAKAQGGGQGQLSRCGTSGEGTCQVRWAVASGVSAGRHPARSRPRGQRANGGHQSLVTKTVTPPRQAPPPPTPPSSAAGRAFSQDLSPRPSRRVALRTRPLGTHRHPPSLSLLPPPLPSWNRELEPPSLTDFPSVGPASSSVLPREKQQLPAQRSSSAPIRTRPQ